MKHYTCPLCGRSHDSIKCKILTVNENKENGEKYIGFFCDVYECSFFLIDHLYTMPDQELKEKLLNLIVEHILHNKYCNIDHEDRLWHFYLDNAYGSARNRSPEYFNLANTLKTYPQQIMDTANRLLVNLSYYFPRYGDRVWDDIPARIAFMSPAKSITVEVGRLLEELGYVTEKSGEYRISVAGWQKIEGLKKEERTTRQAFIAMIFREEANSIREAFRRAIHEMGYIAVVLDEKEHNNQIVPEIFYEIKRSKFAVVDVTYPSYGAYYEAGYAQALDKEVIICCRRDVFDRYQQNTPFRYLAEIYHCLG